MGTMLELQVWMDACTEGEAINTLREEGGS